MKLAGPPRQRLFASRNAWVAALALASIAVHLLLRFAVPGGADWAHLPLLAALVLGGAPLLWDLAVHVARLEFGADLLAGISIITAVILGEYLAGALVVLMLSGGGALEAMAVGRASSVLDALARRMPSIARRKGQEGLEDVPLDQVAVGDVLVLLPHDVCPADGVVLEGHGAMDESYLTGEPYVMSKTPGATVLSGAINGESVLTVRAQKKPVDSRYARIMAVMERSQQQRPKLRRMADLLGAWYTPIAVCLALAAWMISGEALRFLAVLVVATPCPLLIAVPVAIIGAISQAARHSIIVRDPVSLERVPSCRTVILDKTGTLTYGRPSLIAQHVAEAFDRGEVLALAASLEQYSKHPLAVAIVEAAQHAGLSPPQASDISEPPGEGLRGTVGGRSVRITSRARLLAAQPELAATLASQQSGLECVVLIGEQFAALYQFRDAPRPESRAFVGHLGRRHGVRDVLLVSGDRESEVDYLARQVGIERVYASQSPEQKVRIVQEENRRGPTLFIGDGVNDAPALLTATVGVAMGTRSDVTTESAGAVILDSDIGRVDELLHISRRMRRIALQSAIGGMALSVVGMLFAAAGRLPPVAGAIVQEIIDVAVILNALRVGIRAGRLRDY